MADGLRDHRRDRAVPWLLDSRRGADSGAAIAPLLLLETGAPHPCLSGPLCVYTMLGESGAPGVEGSSRAVFLTHSVSFGQKSIGQFDSSSKN